MENNNVAVVDDRKAKKEAAAKIRNRKKRVKRIVGLVTALVVVGGIAFGMYSLFHEKEVKKEIWSDFVRVDSIRSMVTGYGQTKALNSATLTLTSGGAVREVFITNGQKVNEGDPLYTVDSTEAEKAVEEAKKTVQDYQKQIDALNKSYAELTMTAPFAGKIINVADLKVGEELPLGTTVAKLVDDKVMKLSLYFSYAYEKDIAVGNTAQISIPSTMNVISGTVSEINRVERISKEGSKLFEVVFSVPNPNTLTDGMGATAILTGSNGEIYPYEPGELAYNRSQELKSKASGELLAVHLNDYADVSAGQVLVQMKGDDNDNQMAELRTSMKTAQETLDKATKNLNNYNAAAPISGTVISCSLTPGETVEAGRVAVTIADLSVMVVEAQIDSLNIMYVKPGMPCDITVDGRDGTIAFFGTVETVSLEGKFDQNTGSSYFPATIRVETGGGGDDMGMEGDMAMDGGMGMAMDSAVAAPMPSPDGGGAAGGEVSLQPGMSVSYSMVASQSDNCLVIQQQAVKYTEAGTVVLVKADLKPENALENDMLGGMEVPEGYYAVPVTIGLSDQTSVEILEGLEEGQEIFVQYMTDRGDSWSSGGMMVG